MNITDNKFKSGSGLNDWSEPFHTPELVLAIPATSLVLVAFVLKARKGKYYREHYAVAMAGFILTAVAIPIGLRAVLLSYARFMTWPLTCCTLIW